MVTQAGRKTILPVRRSRKQEGKLYFQLDGDASRKGNTTSSEMVTKVGRKNILPVRRSCKQEGKLYFQLDGHASGKENNTSS